MKIQLLILVATFFIGAPMSVGSPSEVSEYKAKALFLGTLLKYTKFPESNKYSIAVIGKNPFHGHLKTLHGRKINNRKVTVSFFKHQPHKIDQYHIIFIAKTEKILQKQILNNVGNNTITVADNKWFLSSGGHINLVLKKKNLRWEVNYQALKNKRFQISSKVLRIALNKKNATAN